MNDSKYKNSRGSRNVQIPVELIDEIAEIQRAWDAISEMLNGPLYFLLKPHMEQMHQLLQDITERYETAESDKESDNEEVPFRIPRVPASPTHPCDIGKKGGAQ